MHLFILISHLSPVEGAITGTSLVSWPDRALQRTPTSSLWEQSVRPQIPCRQSSREVSVPSQWTSSRRIRPTPSPNVASDTTSAWPLKAEKSLMSALCEVRLFTIVDASLFSFTSCRFWKKVTQVVQALKHSKLQVEYELFRKLQLMYFPCTSEFLMFNIAQLLLGIKQATVFLEKRCILTSASKTRKKKKEMTQIHRSEPQLCPINNSR